jgi:hypothetical protein
LFPNDSTKPDDLFGEVLTFVEDQYGEDVNGDIFKDCPIYIVVEMDDGGSEELLFVVVMDAACVYQRQARGNIRYYYPLRGRSRRSRELRREVGEVPFGNCQGERDQVTVFVWCFSNEFGT